MALENLRNTTEKQPLHSMPLTLYGRFFACKETMPCKSLGRFAMQLQNGSLKCSELQISPLIDQVPQLFSAPSLHSFTSRNTCLHCTHWYLPEGRMAPASSRAINVLYAVAPQRWHEFWGLAVTERSMPCPTAAVMSDVG